MAGAILERKLTGARSGCIEFDIASEADDAEIRRLLRNNPTKGSISISLEREPHYFADSELPGEVKQTIVARQSKRIVCVGSCVIRERYINGKPRRVGYLGGLRLDAAYGGRFDIVRRGYEMFRLQQAEAPADFYFTSIASDNRRARKFLERGLPGMPLYEFAGDFVTALIPASGVTQRMSRDAATVPAVAEAVALLNEHSLDGQFSLCWSAEQIAALEKLGLKKSHFLAIRGDEQSIACAALWDQRAFKQTVIRGFAGWLNFARSCINLFAGSMNYPRLPAVGETLSFAVLSHVAVARNDGNAFGDLVADLRRVAFARGIKLLSVGLAAGDPRLASLRKRIHFREYRTRIYVVRWPAIGAAASELDDRCLAPELALL